MRPMEFHRATFGNMWLKITGILILTFLLLPCFLVVPISFSASHFLEFPPARWSTRWYVSFLSSPEWREATLMSVKLALATTMIATPLGTSAAYGLSILRHRALKS